MKYKLLNKTLLYYVVFSLVVVSIAAPAFYLLTQRLFVHEADELLFLHKNEFMNSNYGTFKLEDIPSWNKISRDIKILDQQDRLKKDRLYTRLILDSLDNEMVPYRILLSPIMVEGQPKVFMARVSLIESDALIKNIAVSFFWILILLLTGLFLITRILSARLWKPFFSTVQQLETFELDKNSAPILVETSIEEFDRLNKATSKLLEKNLVIFKSQKEFVENAAHELQTPIALFLAKLDVMIQEMPITPQLGEALTELHQAASRIVRLNKNLLLLSRIENDQYPSLEKVVVSSIVEKQSAFIREQLAEKNVTLTLSIDAPFTTNANPTLLEVAIGNLLLNALRHNLPGGRIAVILGGNTLRISNSGTVALKQDDKLFQRFATPGTNGGSGLGLAIVKKVSDQHGWRLSYTFEEQLHQFTIVF